MFSCAGAVTLVTSYVCFPSEVTHLSLQKVLTGEKMWIKLCDPESKAAQHSVGLFKLTKIKESSCLSISC
jgi:hypothetical protein